MGRQIQVLMNETDEKDFILFLQSTADIQIIESFAPTMDELWVEGFNHKFIGHHTYLIWNKDFAWQPEYGSVGSKAHNPSHIGWCYVTNTSSAPILEVSRSNPSSGSSGRLYWSRNFSAQNGLAYDEASFSKWVDTIWRWVRKHGKKVKELPLQPYVFPGALSQLAPNKSFNGDALSRAR